ncbi:MAG: transglutaminase family protein [Eubacteriales bacterium]
MGLINDTIEKYSAMFPDGASVTSTPMRSATYDSDAAARGTGVFDDMDFAASELKYRAFVNDIYTRLPQDFPEQIVSLATEVTKDANSDYYKAVAIEQYLAKNYKYTLNPKAPYDDEADFVYSFLFDTKEGYCTYYATAMVTMMRSLGIPARYVEGFAVDNTRNVGRTPTVRNPALTSIFDYNAHAWAEVYFPGIGWLPFEPTTATQVEETVEQEPSYQPPVRLPVSDGSMMPTNPPVEDDTEDLEETIKFNAGYVAFFTVLGIFLIFYYILRLINFIVNKGRINRFLRSAPTVAVRLMLNYTLRLLSYCGYDMTNDEGLTTFALRVLDKSEFMINTHFDRIAELMQKARFSSTPLTEEERGEVYSFVKMMRHSLYRNSNFRDRMKLKYLWVIL